ncbi:MAG: transglycosylase SLT domain-containing protein [Cytophagaceae bacterium]
MMNFNHKILTGFICITVWMISSAPAQELEMVDSLQVEPVSEEIIPQVEDDVIAQRLKSLEKSVKLTFNKKTRGFIDYFTVRNRRYAKVMERRRNVYFPIFEEAFKKHEMPDELKYLAIVESGLNPKALSKAGAAGLWQFMPSTGKIYKLNQDSYIDERLDPYKSTEAACRYLKDLYNIFNDWELALASYNCGPGNVRKAIRKSGYKETFWQIYDYLPQETRGYVPQFVALTYVMNHLEDHNIIADSLEYPIRFDTIMVADYLNIDILCEQLDICKEDFIKLNPALKRSYLPDNYNYPVRIPYEKSEYFAVNRIEILDNCNRRFSIEPEPLFADNTRFNSSSKSVSSQSTKTTFHVVKSGEVLSKIASKYNVSVNDIKKWNNLKTSNIQKGQKLVIKTGKTSSSSQSQVNLASASKPKAETTPKVYYVQPGDTLYSIARKYENVSIETIKKLNNLKTNELKVGQKLLIG